MRYRISSPTRSASLASIPTRGWRIFSLQKRSAMKRGTWIALPSREAPDEIDEVRLLAARFRRVVTQRRKRKHASDVAVREAACTAQRTNRLRLNAHRRTESQRHQGCGGGFSGRLVHGCSA